MTIKEKRITIKEEPNNLYLSKDMDPSTTLCRYKNSFDKSKDTPIILHTYVTTKKETDDTVNSKAIFSDKPLVRNNDKNANKYCNPSSHSQTKVNMIPNNVPNNIKIFDPFYDVPSKPFMNRDAITLANLDMVFNFSDHTSGYIIKQESVKDLSFAVIDDGPGGFAQYIMYRNPSSYGYGTTPSDHPFNTKAIDMTHFNIIEGPSGNGNIKKDYKYFIKSIRTVEATGIGIILGNYVNDYDINPIGYLVRLIIGLGTVNIGGKFICKISNLNNDLMIDLLYITSQCFNKITLFKPLSTPIQNDIYYVVCEDAKINNIEWISYLENSYSSSLKNNKEIIRLIDPSNVPQDFIIWISKYNNLILLHKKYLTNQINIGIKEIYDTYKCKAIWNLPQI